MAADDEYDNLSPEEFARRVELNDDWTFIFMRPGPGGRPVRDVKFVVDCSSLDLARLLFWGERDRSRVFLAAILREQVATVDDYTDLADEPQWEQIDPERGVTYAQLYEEYLRRATANPSLLQHFTVYGGWDTDGRLKPFMKYVEAIDALHAELIVRAMTSNRGTFLVAGVVELWVPQEELPEAEGYGGEDPDGTDVPAAALFGAETLLPPSSPSRLPLLVGMFTVIVAAVILGLILL